jgi:hypothetical protein
MMLLLLAVVDVDSSAVMKDFDRPCCIEGAAEE